MAATITQEGTTLVLAGGNSPYAQDHDALKDVPGVIIVSSVDKDNNHGSTGHAHKSSIDICAPGKNISVATKNNSIMTESGTSLAAPYVSGTIGLMLSVNSDLTPA